MKFKRQSELLSEMIDHTITSTDEINDFTPGSSNRVLYEAVAIKLEELYILSKENIREGIIEGVFSAYGFTRKKAQRAFNDIRLEFTSPLPREMTIPRGTQFLCSDRNYTQVYETMVQYVVPAGRTTAMIEVYCTQPGEYGNIPAGMIDTLRVSMPNVANVTNPEDFNTGAEEEPIEDVFIRFQDYIESLARGTEGAIKYATKNVEGVSGAHVQTMKGLFEVYAHDLNGNLSNSLINSIDDALLRYRAAGIPYRILPVGKVSQDVTVTVYVRERDNIRDAFKAKITSSIRDYLNRRVVSEDLLVSDLSRSIMNIDRKVIQDIHIAKPEANIIVPKSGIIRAGNVNVTLELFTDQ